MNFPLNQLEQNVPEEFLVEGEQLFEAQKIKQLVETEKHLWSATVDDTYEIELQITPSKVQAYSCECDTFAVEGVCEHIVAGLLALRQHLQHVTQQNKADRQQKLATKRPKKLTPSVILDNVTLEELSEFVRQYANRDRNFALALKARFAGTVEFFDDKEKYLQLLETSIEAARKADRMISFRGARKLLKVLQELQQQAELAIVQQHFTTALYIAQSIIEKVTPVLRKIEREREAITHAIEQAFSLIRTILEKHAAPLLEEEIWMYCLEECTKLTYRINDMAMHFYRILLQIADTPERQHSLLATLDELLFHPQTTDENFSRLLLAKLSLLEKPNRQQEARALVRQNLQQPEILSYALKQALQRQDWKLAKQLATEGLQFTEDTSFQGKLEDALLHIAQAEQDEEAQATYALRRLLATLDMKYLPLLKSSLNGEWIPIRDEILQSVQQRPYSLEHRNFIAALYAEEGLYRNLLDYITQVQSLDVLQQYLKLLLPDYQSEAFQLYKALLNDYVKNHLGRKSSQRVREKLEQLYQIGASEFANELVEDLRSQYAERHSLIEELAMF